MSHIIITTLGARISTRQGRLVLLKEGEVTAEWPLEQVAEVSCFGPVGISGYAMGALMDRGAPLHLFTKGGRLRGTLFGQGVDHLVTTLAQVDRWKDEAFGLEVGRLLIRHKLKGQRGVPEDVRGADVADARAAIDQGLQGLKTASDSATLMGVEGAAARGYFNGLARLLPEDVPWGGRSRQPPLDPPNALLSLGYVLLGNLIGGMVRAAGFDPRLGFLHGLRYGRESLALDLVEPLRPLYVDRFVLTLFNRRRVRPEDFEAREDGGIYLRRERFKVFMSLWSAHLGQPREAGSRWAGIYQLLEGLRGTVMDGELGPLGDALAKMETYGGAPPIEQASEDAPF